MPKFISNIIIFGDNKAYKKLQLIKLTYYADINI